LGFRFWLLVFQLFGFGTKSYFLGFAYRVLLEKAKIYFLAFSQICLKSQKVVFGFLAKTQKVETRNPKSKPKMFVWTT
jgi:hypothetical protein